MGRLKRIIRSSLKNADSAQVKDRASLHGVGSSAFRKNVDCEILEYDNWALSQFVIDRLVPLVGVHPFPLEELILMVKSVEISQPNQIFEWGTNIGKSALAFRTICDQLKPECVVHSIDLPDGISHPEHPEDQRGYMVRGLDGVELHQGDGLDTSIRIWKDGGRSSNVLFFLDGDHEYSSVKRELERISLEIPVASILAHDTFIQMESSGYNIGPGKAIAEFLERKNDSYSAIWVRGGLPGMTLVYPNQIR